MSNQSLPPEVFEAVVNALAEALVRDYRSQHGNDVVRPHAPENFSSPSAFSPWLTMKEAASRSRCGVKTLFREVHAGRLRAVKVGGRRTLRLRAEWIDAWLEAMELPSNRGRQRNR